MPRLKALLLKRSHQARTRSINKTLGSCGSERGALPCSCWGEGQEQLPPVQRVAPAPSSPGFPQVLGQHSEGFCSGTNADRDGGVTAGGKQNHMQPGRLVGGARGLCTRWAPGLCAAPGVQPGGGQRGGKAGHGDAETSKTQPRARGAFRHPPGTTLPSSPAPGGWQQEWGRQLETYQWTTALQKNEYFPQNAPIAQAAASVVYPSPMVLIWGWWPAEV